MSIGYLLTLVIIGGFTAVAVWPARRPRALAKASYLMGLTVNEVPHVAAGVPLAAVVVPAAASGGFGAGWSSMAAALGTVAVATGLVVIARRGVAAWPAVTAALTDAGLDAPRRPRGWAWRTLLTPIPFRPRRISRVAGIRYGEHRRQRLDVYHRRDRPSGGPVLVYLHGGGYFSGGRHREGRALLHTLADRGWICVSAGYRLRPEAGFEDHLADARRALAWARDNAGRYGGDPARLVMAGSSAGAHMTALLALDPETDLTAAICLYGHYGRYYGRTDSEDVASTPFAMPAEDAPPVFIAHGDHDTWTPVEPARALAAKLRRESVQAVVHAELPGGQHGFDLWRSWRCSAVVAGIGAFAAEHVTRPAAAATVAGRAR
ncbi:MAG: alpha/beta hydrolase [Thermoleophilia bacterium]